MFWEAEMEILGKSFYLGICLQLEGQHYLHCDVPMWFLKDGYPCGWWEAAEDPPDGVSTLPLLQPDMVRRTCGKVVAPRITPPGDYDFVRARA